MRPAGEAVRILKNPTCRAVRHHDLIKIKVFIVISLHAYIYENLRC